jgi:hypothetical protein
MIYPSLPFSLPHSCLHQYPITSTHDTTYAQRNQSSSRDQCTTHHHSLPTAWNNMAVFKELFQKWFCKLNYIYKDSETLSLPTTITIPFSISLTCKYYLLNIRKHEWHYPHNLSSTVTLYFIHRWKTELTTKVNLHSVLPHIRNRYSTMQ